nr:hypothetical protein 14 [Desulfobacteraceae bacterium]
MEKRSWEQARRHAKLNAAKLDVLRAMFELEAEKIAYQLACGVPDELIEGLSDKAAVELLDDGLKLADECEFLLELKRELIDGGIWT